MRITESGMTFGDFSDDHFFHIEKSKTYKKVQDSVKIAEFLLIRSETIPAKVWIVEAKPSSPMPENQPRFDQFIEEIGEKLTNSLSLGIAACLKRHPDAATEPPEPFKLLDLSTTEFRFLLVVTGHKKEWLAPINEALAKALRSVVKVWALSPTAVALINEDGARKHGLIAKGEK